MNLHHLRSRRTELRAAANAILDKPAGDDGSLSDEQRTAYDEKRGEIERLTGDIERAEAAAADDAETRGLPLTEKANEGLIAHRVFAGVETRAAKPADGWRTPSGEIVPVLSLEQRIADYAPVNDTAASEIGLNGFLRALVNGPTSEIERRALAEGAVATGGAFLPTPLAAEVIDASRTRNVAFQAGARTVPMTSKTMTMASVVSDPVPEWRAENALIAESEPVFGTLGFSAETLAVRFTVSRELLEDAPNMDAQLRAVMGAAFARGLDNAVFYGSGTGNEPLGIANTPGVQEISMGTDGAALAGWAPFLDAKLALESANEGRITAVVLAPRTNRAIDGLVDSTGQPLSRPPALANVPILSTTGIATDETQGASSDASTAFIGDFSQVLVGIRTQLQITVLNERFAEFGQVGFVGWLRADVQVAKPAAIAKITGIVE